MPWACFVRTEQSLKARSNDRNILRVRSHRKKKSYPRNPSDQAMPWSPDYRWSADNKSPPPPFLFWPFSLLCARSKPLRIVWNELMRKDWDGTSRNGFSVKHFPDWVTDWGMREVSFLLGDTCVAAFVFVVQICFMFENRVYSYPIFSVFWE